MASITGTNGNDTVNAGGASPGVAGGPATDLADTILGLGGDDILEGAGGDDLINGGDGFDRLSGGDGNDTLIGGLGNDFFRGGAGDDSMVGGDASDVVMYEDAAGPVTINIVTGTATGQGTDTLVGIVNAHGSQFGDWIVGSAASQYFFGRGGNDTIQGLDGADNLIGGSGNDVLDGGGGPSDMASYTPDTFDPAGPATRGVVVNLSAGTVVFGADTVGAQRAIDNWGGIDTLLGIENVTGSSQNDVLVGDDNNNALSGEAGNDTLVGGGGDDFLRGGFGSDSIAGGSGFDVVSYTGDGSPIDATVAFNGVSGHSATVTSAEGTDTLREIEAINGTSGNDIIRVLSVDLPASFQARGYGGNDTIIGMADRNFSVFADYRVSGVTSGIVVDLATGIVSNDGFGGQDLLINIAKVRGTDFGDTILGTDGNERFRGRGGSDYLDARGGTGDQLDYTQSGSAVSVNLALERAQDGEGGFDTIIGFEDVRSTAFDDTLIGSAGADLFAPFGGNDRVIGGGGQDRVSYSFGQGNVPPPTQGVVVNLATGIATDGWGGTDTLDSIERINGTNFADSILGGAESNRFRGGAGNDTLVGGLGGDYAEYTTATSGVTVNLTTGVATDGEGGTDRLTSIENVIGSNHADRLTGVAQLARATSLLRGGSGNDTLVGINGQFVVADYADQTTGLTINLGAGTADDGRGGTDSLVNIRGLNMFGDFADVLTGTAAPEWFSPSGGADSVNAGGGADIIAYGGTDAGGVFVNLTTGRAVDTGGSTDTIIGFEGVAASFGDDTIVGNALANLIGPGAGADSVTALGGEDTVSYTLGFAPNGLQFNANEAGDRLALKGVTIDLASARATDYGGDIDTIIGFEHAVGSTVNDMIRGSAAANRLAGAEGNDTIEGRLGNDTLDGGLGNDRMVGGDGNDTYIVEQAGDTVVEALNQGIDTVRTTLAAYTLGANVENLVATTGLARAFNGNALANAITGGAGNDTLNGGAGNDTLTGGAGLDRMAGGLDDDTYIVEQAGDTVVEALNQGADTVITTLASYALAANVENLVAGNDIAHGFTGNALANLLTGGAGNDTLNGGAGDDTLDGGAGLDRLVGGLGNDTHIVDAVGETVVEALNQGIDTVITTLAAYTLAANVENLALAGASAANGTGNGLGNAMLGNAGANLLLGLGGNDTLSGEGGNDTLVGGAGDDTMAGGAGNDQFRFASVLDSAVAAPDLVSDFSFVAGNQDRISLALIDANATLAGDQAFAYIGSAAFSGAAGQLRVQSLGGGLFVASGDVNGDSAADFAIRIVSGSAPVAGWFIL